MFEAVEPISPHITNVTERQKVKMEGNESKDKKLSYHRETARQLGWLTDRAMHRTPQNRRGCNIFDIQTF